MLSALRRLAAFCLCLALCFGLAACSGGANAKPATISPDDMAVIRRQVEGFTAAKERLPELAQLVNQRDWTFTRNLIHGPMQEVGREMLYINQRLLPQDRDQANALAADLKEAMSKVTDLNSILKFGQKTNVEVTLPCFKLESTFDLTKPLKKLGMTDMFDEFKADFSGMTGGTKNRLFVSKIKQKAFIEVNEEGSEAAAATAVVVGVRTIQRKKRFYADKPFIFMIYDFQNNIPLFAGKVIDPTNPIAVQRPPPVVEDSPNSIETSDSLLDEKIVDTTKQVSDSPNLESCPRLIRDFPNALDNHKICNKVKDAGQFLDWLRENRNLCEQSADHYDQFMKNACSPLYCKDSAQKKVNLTRQFTQGCSNIDKNNQQECKNIENQVKAYDALNC